LAAKAPAAGRDRTNNWKLPRRAYVGGTIGLAESYVDGDWHSPDVASFLELFVINVEAGERLRAVPVGSPISAFATGLMPTPGKARSATFPRITTWATSFTEDGSTLR
jgi:hypothetical protein